MKTKYSYKQIWTITFPILISLIMEQMIGMTDTAFLGRVGEIELGASAIAGGILSCYLHDGIRLQHRRTDLNRPPQRRRKLQGNRTDFLSGHLFPACHGSDFIHILHRIFTIYLKEYHFVSSHLRCSRKLYSLACVWVLLLFCHGHVPRLLCRYDTNQNTDAELYRNGAFERGIQLYPDLR